MLGFSIEDEKKVTEKIIQLWIIKKDSEVLRRECVAWIDMSTRTCYIKKFKHISCLTGQFWGMENAQITYDPHNSKVRTIMSHRPIFQNHGVFELKDLPSYFEENSYLDKMVGKFQAT